MRYFFHIDDGALVPDHDGTEMESIEQARAEAVSLAGAVLRDLDGDFWGRGVNWTMHVTDEHDRLLFSLHFSAEVPSGQITYRPGTIEGM